VGLANPFREVFSLLRGEPSQSTSSSGETIDGDRFRIDKGEDSHTTLDAHAAKSAEIPCIANEELFYVAA
jgi:hypothetical protein